MYKTQYQFDKSYVLAVAFGIAPILMVFYGIVTPEKNLETFMILLSTPILAVISYIILWLFPFMLQLLGYETMGRDMSVTEDFVKQEYEADNGETRTRYILNFVVYDKAP